MDPAINRERRFDSQTRSFAEYARQSAMDTCIRCFELPGSAQRNNKEFLSTFPLAIGAPLFAFFIAVIFARLCNFFFIDIKVTGFTRLRHLA